MLRRLPVLTLLAIATLCSVAPVTLADDNLATVHGTVYDIWSFTPLENVMVKASSDSMIQGTYLAIDGTYSLALSPGSYTIKAEYYSDATLVYDAEENIVLQANDNITLDLIMFPAMENELDENYDLLPEDEGEAEAGFLWLGLAAVLIIVVVGVIIFYHRKILRLVEKEVTAPSSARVVGLPDDLNEVLSIVRESGGRINQVELRQKLPYSEAKVSLMISDLESRGLVRKIQKGRGNIVVLAELK